LRDEIGRGKTPPAVLDLLVLGERVGDQREEPRVAAEHFADRERRVPPHRRVAVGEKVHCLRLRQLPAAEREAQFGNRLVEEAHPGSAPRDRFLVQQLFQLVR
jgi:hypothetical protein